MAAWGQEVMRLGDLELPLVFREDFENGRDRWETTDDAAWELREVPAAEGVGAANHTFGLNRRHSDYQPPFRSPHNIALVRELELSDFVMIFQVRNAQDTGGHRDCCAFFCHRAPTQFYYVHLGAQPDPASGQIMIVNERDRAPLTENNVPVPWDEAWHTVKVTRVSTTGRIEVFFDDLRQPLMTVEDKTLERGRVGVGSFDDMNDFDDVCIWGR